MEKREALMLIDTQNKRLINPNELLDWVTLRVIIMQIPEDEWERYRDMAAVILSR